MVFTASSAWQGAQPQKLTVSMLLPGTSSASEWRDLLQSRRQFWPTLTTRHASLVPVSAEALQRERRQMQVKHLWYNLDIRWVDLKDKLEVLAPIGLTRDDIWRHPFLTKQRKNPYEEGCYTGEDLEDVKRKWEAKKEYFLQYKKDGSHPPCIDLATALHGFNIDNTAAYHAIEDSKLHARRWQTKEGIYRIKRQALPDVRDAPLNDDNAAASSTDVKPRWRNWDEDCAMGYQRHPQRSWTRGYLMLPHGVQHMRASGSFGRFTLFSPPVSPSNDTCRWSFVLVFCWFVWVFFCFVVFLFPVLQVSWNFSNPPRVLDLDD